MMQLDTLTETFKLDSSHGSFLIPNISAVVPDLFQFQLSHSTITNLHP